MTNLNLPYDKPTREIYLLENTPIQGRKTELRQLLKLLNLAKTGQPKAALITGDSGIGKSALLNAFVQVVQEGVYCRVLDLGVMTYQTPEALYVALVEKLQADAHTLLDEALSAVNEITTRELDLRWERHDLTRAISLVKLQETIPAGALSKDATQKDQLVKAIRSQVPTVKKLKLSTNESIEKLVDLILNPWVTTANALLNPSNPSLVEAMRLADALRSGKPLSDIAFLPKQPSGEVRPLARASQPETLRESASQPVTVNSPLTSATERPAKTPYRPEVIVSEGRFVDGIVSAPRPMRKKLTDEPSTADSDLSRSPDHIMAPHDGVQGESPTAGLLASTVSKDAAALQSRIIESTRKPVKDPLIQHLMVLFDFINHAIDKLDTGVLIMMDEWDRILAAPAQSALKTFMTEWLYQMTERSNYHYMIVTTARTEGESYTLGGSIYNHFRTKLLLDPLDEAACNKLAKLQLTQLAKPVTVDESVLSHLYRLSRGNPFWHLKAVNYMAERVESNHTLHVDTDFYGKLGIDAVEHIPELSFTRLRLAFLNDEAALSKVIASLIQHFGEAPFSANRAIREISTSQNFTDAYVFEVLRALFRHDFLREADAPGAHLVKVSHTGPDGIEEALDDILPGSRPTGQGTAYKPKAESTRDPHYAIQSRITLQFLQAKTRTVQTDISTDDKLMYLKKIIPLSIQSGDLDREKTMEVLALSDVLGNPELITFLETTFLEALNSDKPAVRVTALNNIAVIDSGKARESLLGALRDESSMVREYAARNLSTIAQKCNDSRFMAQIADQIIDCLDDESEAVRTQIYHTLSATRWNSDLTSVFIKGMTDACESVRLIAIRNLAQVQPESSDAMRCLLDSLSDPLVEIRRFACIGLHRYISEDAGNVRINAIVKCLQRDPDKGMRVLAAESLSTMDSAKAFEALVNALRKENAEDVKVSIVRALGKRRGWQTEAILLEALNGADLEAMPVFVWAALRSLGQVGGTARSLSLLSDIASRVTNPILLSAVDIARRKIQEHMRELQMMERQLGEATPMTIAIPSEYEEEVDVPEDDRAHEEHPHSEPMPVSLADNSHERSNREESVSVMRNILGAVTTLKPVSEDAPPPSYKPRSPIDLPFLRK